MFKNLRAKKDTMVIVTEYLKLAKTFESLQSNDTETQSAINEVVIKLFGRANAYKENNYKINESNAPDIYTDDGYPIWIARLFPYEYKYLNAAIRKDFSTHLGHIDGFMIPIFDTCNNKLIGFDIVIPDDDIYSLGSDTYTWLIAHESGHMSIADRKTGLQPIDCELKANEYAFKKTGFSKEKVKDIYYKVMRRELLLTIKITPALNNKYSKNASKVVDRILSIKYISKMIESYIPK